MVDVVDMFRIDAEFGDLNGDEWFVFERETPLEDIVELGVLIKDILGVVPKGHHYGIKISCAPYSFTKSEWNDLSVSLVLHPDRKEGLMCHLEVVDLMASGDVVESEVFDFNDVVRYAKDRKRRAV